MLKSVVRLLTLPVLFALALAGSPAASPPGMVQIVQLEESRSLGNGRLAYFLSSADRSLALRAALAIGRTKQPAGIRLLEARTTDRDPAMRALAVYGLGLIGGAAAAPAVLRGLEDDSAEVVRVSALDATDRLETAHSLDAAAERRAQIAAARLLRHGGPIIRARAATALAAFTGGKRDRQALGALSSAYRSERDSYVRWHVVWSLYRAYAKEAPYSLLTDALNDRDEVVRIEAVRALGKRGNVQAVNSLERMLGDTSWRVREQALESIRVLRGGKPTEHLTAIPGGVQTPAPVPDALAALRALARTPVRGKPRAPSAQTIIQRPSLDPQTPALFTRPASGPHPRVRIVTTQGNLYVELYPEWAPLTVENFLDLANRGYYDGNPWFRIVPDFVVQTGDPHGNGNGDAGYSIPAEENPIEQDSYVISMGLNYTNPPNAHAIRDSAGTQFYITLSPQLHLNRDFTVFGKVVSGFDVLGRLIERDRIVRVERIPDTKG